MSTLRQFYSAVEVADMLSVSKATLEKWRLNGRLVPLLQGDQQLYAREQLYAFDQARWLFDESAHWKKEVKENPVRCYRSIELFAGAGGLALGLEKAGFEALLLNELDKSACATLRKNRPSWNVVEGDVSGIDFTPWRGKIDLLSGGFPCQAFSYAGQKRGFEDTRGTLFFEFARAIQEVQPRVFLGENVRGLLKHDGGQTIQTIREAVDDLGYALVEPRVLRAFFYQVPQKRERLFLVGVRKDLLSGVDVESLFAWPAPYHRILSVKDALKAGVLYENDVPQSEGQRYPERKAEILKHVPQGGYWRDLSDELQREYMKGSYFLGGGKTGMARRLSWDEPSLTLTCAPAQKQTERCHPEETRPLTVREYARIQTFPDDWQFQGSIHQQYKQIGNAVPVNLAFAMGRSLMRLLQRLDERACDLTQEKRVQRKSA